MESSSRFRFRDLENSTQSDSSSDVSSLYSDRDDEFELRSMAGMGIKHLCSELLELKEESNEDFQRNIFSSYSAFVRIFEEVEGVETELMKLKNHVSTQKRLVKELIDGVYLKILSEETIESITEESVYLDPPQPSELEAHINNVSETLDILLSENRIDEALDIIELEDENCLRMQFEGNAPSDVLMVYNSAISERKTMLALQLTLVAENSRIAAPELQNALVGLCRLGDSHLATQLLLKYYHSRIATGILNLQHSKSYKHGVYIRELAKFVFSMISQAASSFVMLYVETSPYASELIQWACEETKVFIACFNKYVKSISEISGGLSRVVEAVQFAMSFCSLLETQTLVLRPYLIKHIRPIMEEVLRIPIDHFKKVVGIFIATDSWVLGRYLVSGIVNERCSSMVVGQQPEYCLLTNSGRKFVTLLQAITEDVSPLVAFQMEGSILSGLMNLFTEYIIILERAITCETNVTEKGGSRINLAESLPQQVSVLANLSTLEHFFSRIVKNIFGSVTQINSELMKNHSIGGQQKELDSCMLFIQEAYFQLRAHFCQQFVHRIMLLETSSKGIPQTCIDGEHDLMPSIALQVLFLELRKLEKLAEDGVFEVDWLMELLRELIEAIFFGISNSEEIWAPSEENLTVQHSDNFKQFVLDMQFLVKIASYGGYFSNNTSVLVNSMKSAFLSAGLDPERDDMDYGWARNAADKAIAKLLEIEKTNLPPNDDYVGILEAETHKNQSDYASDSLQDDTRCYSNDSMESEDDVEIINVSEEVFNADTMILNTEFSPLGGPSDLLEEEEGSIYKTALNSTESSVETDGFDLEEAANAEYVVQITEITDLPATLSVDINEEYSEVRVLIEGTSCKVDAAEYLTNKLEDGEDMVLSGDEVASAEDTVGRQGKDEGMA